MAEPSTLARPYARAAFQSADAQQTLDVWSKGLSILASLVNDTKVKQLLDSPAIGATAKAKQVQSLVGDDLAAEVSQFVTVLIESDRLALAGEIYQQYESLRAEREHIVPVQIETAYELTEVQIKLLSASLQKRFGKQITIEVKVNPALIAGVVIYANDEVIDDSVRGRLQKLMQTLTS